MNLDGVRQIADAVLYEGYVLYPYRASAQKNRSRWQFGVLMPPSYADPSEGPVMQAECVFAASGSDSGSASAEVTVRFLQVQRRSGPGPGDVWDEAVPCEVPVIAGGDPLFGDGTDIPFTIDGGDGGSADEAGVSRRRERLSGVVSVRARPLPGPWRAARLTVRVANQTDVAGAGGTRADALPFALVAAHMIITLSGGEFVSMTDPPEWAAAAAGECRNDGCWPVLAGPAGTRNVVLASPIILPDHPEVAQESPGELYDGTEIDEILTLRTLALTDAEKDAARATDARAAALIDRVESLGSDGPALERMHGVMRASSSAVPWWDPEADTSVSPSTDSVLVAGQRLARGSRVLLRPGARRTDAQDMFLAGRPAVVEAVLLDVEDRPYLAVSLEDDPAAGLQAAHGRFRYFAPDEVEPLEAGPE